MNNITSNYYIGLLEQCEIEQDIFESMLEYDYKLASLGSINESTISDIDAKYLTEASENIFHKMWNGVLFVLRKIKEFFINVGKWVKGLFDKDKKKNKIIEQQVKEAENAAKQDKVIIDAEVAKDNLQDKSESELDDLLKDLEKTKQNTFKSMSDRHKVAADYIKNAVNDMKEKSDNIENLKNEINDLLKSFDETTYTADNGQKRKGVVVDKDVSKKIIPFEKRHNSQSKSEDLVVQTTLPDVDSLRKISKSLLEYYVLNTLIKCEKGDISFIKTWLDNFNMQRRELEYTQNDVTQYFLISFFGGGYIPKTKEDLHEYIKKSIYKDQKPKDYTLKELNETFDAIQKIMDEILISDHDKCINAINRIEKINADKFSQDQLDYIKKIAQGCNEYINILYMPYLSAIQKAKEKIQNEMQKATHNVIIRPSQNEE